MKTCIFTLVCAIAMITFTVSPAWAPFVGTTSATQPFTVTVTPVAASVVTTVFILGKRIDFETLTTFEFGTLPNSLTFTPGKDATRVIVEVNLAGGAAIVQLPGNNQFTISADTQFVFDLTP